MYCLFPSYIEALQYEIGLRLHNQDNIPQLEQRTLTLYRLTDSGRLKLETEVATFTSVMESFWYQQRIYGYPKKPKKQTVSSVGTDIVIGIILLLLTIALFIIAYIVLRAALITRKY